MILNFKKIYTSNIITIVYFLGLIFGAFFLGIWDADTSVKKGLIVLAWTIIYLILLFKLEQKKN